MLIAHQRGVVAACFCYVYDNNAHWNGIELSLIIIIYFLCISCSSKSQLYPFECCVTDRNIQHINEYLTMNSKRGRTYGKKKPVPNTTSAIFAKSNLPSPSAQDSPIIKADIFNEKSEEVALHDDDMPSKQSPVLKDLVEVFSALEIKTPGSDELRAETSIQPSNQPPTKHLLSLAETDSLPISIESWRSVLPENCTLAKIAEASYAEVYRITTSSATSIVKIMPLKLPDDAESERRTYASDIKDVIPELRIMNILTEIPGFVQFKGARIVTGKQAPQFVQAWEEWASTGEEEVTGWNSEFEHPGDYADGATFLAIELGDAGDVLEEVMVDSKEKFWDIFLGTVIALARAEAMHEFEVCQKSLLFVLLFVFACTDDPAPRLA